MLSARRIDSISSKYADWFIFEKFEKEFDVFN